MIYWWELFFRISIESLRETISRADFALEIAARFDCQVIYSRPMIARHIRNRSSIKTILFAYSSGFTRCVMSIKPTPQCFEYSKKFWIPFVISFRAISFQIILLLGFSLARPFWAHEFLRVIMKACLLAGQHVLQALLTVFDESIIINECKSWELTIKKKTAKLRFYNILIPLLLCFTGQVFRAIGIEWRKQKFASDLPNEIEKVNEEAEDWMFNYSIINFLKLITQSPCKGILISIFIIQPKWISKWKQLLGFPFSPFRDTCFQPCFGEWISFIQSFFAPQRS